jgi:uncharacterized protein YndB with AHSA1/START domain
MTDILPKRGPDTELVIRRVVKAPRELVWKAWTEAEHVARWWGPEGLTTRVEQHDFRVGGATRYVMVAEDGTEYPAEGVFIEIEAPHRIITTDEFAEDYDGPEGVILPTGTILTVTFDEVEGGTQITLHISHPTKEQKQTHEEMGVVAGWNSTIDELESYLQKIGKRS